MYLIQFLEVFVPVSYANPYPSKPYAEQYSLRHDGTRRILVLLCKNRVCVSLYPRVKNQQIALQCADGLVGQPYLLSLHAFIAVETKVIDPAVRRRVLILLANGRLQYIDFDLAGASRKLARR